MVEDEIIIFMIVYYLCVDMVLWCIIVQDFGQFLEMGLLLQDECFFFKEWCII